MPLRLNIRGVKETQEKLRRFLDELGDMTDLWTEYGEIMSRFELRWFDTDGDGLWPPLAYSTLKAKRSQTKPAPLPDPDKTLYRWGDLQESLTDPLQAMEIGQGRTAAVQGAGAGMFTINAMSWGTDVTDRQREGREYAHYHQNVDPVTGEPADYPPRPPERTVIPKPLPLDVLAEMEAADREFVEKAKGKAGLE